MAAFLMQTMLGNYNDTLWLPSARLLKQAIAWLF